MKSRITAASIAILIIVVLAFGTMMFVKDSEDDLERQALAFERLRALSEELESTGVELVLLSGHIADGLNAWKQRIRELDADLQRIRADIEPGDRLYERVSQLGQLWDRRQAELSHYRQALESLDEHFPELVDNASGLLIVDFPQSASRETSAAMAAELADFAGAVVRIREASARFDQHTAALATEIAERSDRFVTIADSIVPFILIIVVAGTALILIRINRLHRAILRDNSARRRAEQSARRSERDLLTTLQSIGDAVFVIDNEGKIQRMNRAAEELTGWSAADAIGRPIGEILVVETPRPETEEPIPIVAHLAAAPANETGPDLTIRRRDGATRFLNGSASPMRADGDTASGIVLALRDVTERHILEERLRQTQKLESIGQLAGGIAHDFNNLLQVVLGNTAILAASADLDDEQKDIVREIREAGSRAAELTDQLLAFSRKQALSIRSEDLAPLVERSLRMIRRLCPPNVEIRFDPRGQQIHVLADGSHLEQALINLVLNARDAMPDGGRITIDISEVEIFVDREGEGGEKKGRFGCIRVSDTGIGMSEEVLKRAYEPFFTTKDVGEGSGLGLSMVHGIVQQHGGFMQIDSEPGRGTSVSVHIPIDPNAATDSPADGEAEEAPAGGTIGKRTILVAEDDPSVRNLMIRLLRKAGHEVLVATDGTEACDLVDLQPARIDLLLTDIVMPDIDGVAVAHYLRSKLPGVPVIFCTG
ncbi:MAG: PAS domain S-box protein, partial [Verrucomicrobia bacterium]